MDTTIIWSNIIVATAALAGGGIQAYFAGRRHTKQLAYEREKYQRERRKDVRGEPLRKLSGEVAKMATRVQLLIAALEGKKMSRDVPLVNQVADTSWEYLVSGDFLCALYTVDDSEIQKMAEWFSRDCIRYLNIYHQKPEEVEKVLLYFQEAKKRVEELQSLINKRLEAL